MHQVAALARQIASTAHQGQVDKAGAIYIQHPERVVGYAMHAVIQELADYSPPLDPEAKVERAAEVRAVAWLHDVIEDCEGYTPERLEALGVPSSVVYRVLLLSRCSADGSKNYYDAIRPDSIARLVKVADLYDNTDPERLARLPVQTRERLLRKYVHAARSLGVGLPISDDRPRLIWWGPVSPSLERIP